MPSLLLADFSDDELDGELRHRQNARRITVEDQRRAGLHSKIPACCVDFFCKYLSVESQTCSRIELYREAVFVSNWQGQYFPCFDCWVHDRHVEIHECDDSRACRELLVPGKKPRAKVRQGHSGIGTR
jgi:hypothetical protein